MDDTRLHSKWIDRQLAIFDRSMETVMQSVVTVHLGRGKDWIWKYLDQNSKVQSVMAHQVLHLMEGHELKVLPFPYLKRILMLKNLWIPTQEFRLYLALQWSLFDHQRQADVKKMVEDGVFEELNLKTSSLQMYLDFRFATWKDFRPFLLHSTSHSRMPKSRRSRWT